MKKVIILIMTVFILSLISCTVKKDEKHEKDENLTVKDIEIFKDTLAWDFARALEKSNLKKAKEILSDNGDLVNYQDPEFGTTLLMRAILTENYKAVEFLLQNRAYPNIVAKVGGSRSRD